MSFKIISSHSHNPWFNLAYEDYIFRNCPLEQRILFLWRNAPSVIIGRFQNPWDECNLTEMEKKGVNLVRRQSGGGTVYQDLENSIFTFISSKENYSKDDNYQILLNCLKSFAIVGERSGRNDILVAGKKVSGNAFKENKDRAFHHGTMLLNTNLDDLNFFISPHKKKLQSKAIASVRSRVDNLSTFHPGINHQLFCDALQEEFLAFYGQSNGNNKAIIFQNVDESELEKNSDVKKYYDKIHHWQWRFGETPKFEIHFENRLSFGQIDVHLNSWKGKITNLKIFSDCLYPDLIENFENSLINKTYNRDGLEESRSELLERCVPEWEEHINNFIDWLTSAIE